MSNVKINPMPNVGRFLIEWNENGREYALDIPALPLLRLLEKAGRIEFLKQPNEFPGDGPYYLRQYATIFATITHRITGEPDEVAMGACVYDLAARIVNEWPGDLIATAQNDPEASQWISSDAPAAFAIPETKIIAA